MRPFLWLDMVTLSEISLGKQKKTTDKTFQIDKKNIIDFKTIFETNDVEAQNIDR